MYIMSEDGLTIVNTEQVDAICVMATPNMENIKIYAINGPAENHSILAAYENLEEAKAAMFQIFKALDEERRTLDMIATRENRNGVLTSESNQ